MGVRAVGSNEVAAYRLGARVDRTAILAYVLCSLFAAVGGLLLAAQVGVGDPTVGQNYTLQSISAVVLGGASIFGGRGSFLGALAAVLLIQEITSDDRLPRPRYGMAILVAGPADPGRDGPLFADADGFRSPLRRASGAAGDDLMSGKVGMIGVGVMGFAMARNLRQAGFDVVGYDPAPGARERLVGIGADVVEVAASGRRRPVRPSSCRCPRRRRSPTPSAGENGLAAASARGTVAIECSTLAARRQAGGARRSGRRRKDPARLPPQRDRGPGRGQRPRRVRQRRRSGFRALPAVSSRACRGFSVTSAPSATAAS